MLTRTAVTLRPMVEGDLPRELKAAARPRKHRRRALPDAAEDALRSAAAGKRPLRLTVGLALLPVAGLLLYGLSLPVHDVTTCTTKADLHPGELPYERCSTFPGDAVAGASRILGTSAAAGAVLWVERVPSAAPDAREVRRVRRVKVACGAAVFALGLGIPLSGAPAWLGFVGLLVPLVYWVPVGLLEARQRLRERRAAP
jgi:hypothetical protein